MECQMSQLSQDRKRSLPKTDETSPDDESPAKQRPIAMNVDIVSDEDTIDIADQSDNDNDSMLELGADFFAEIDETCSSSNQGPASQPEGICPLNSQPDTNGDCDIRDTHADLFEMLDNSVIEKILSTVPIRDLCGVVTRVSKRLNSVVSRPCFLHWKKLYFRYRLGSDTSAAATQIAEILKEEFENCFTFLLHTIVYVHNHFKKSLNLRQRKELLRRLQSHRLSSATLQWLDVNVQGFLLQTQTPWAELAAQILVCSDALEITALIRDLTGSGSPISFQDVSECLYCLAVFLLAANRHFKITPRFHYELYSAIYFLENEGTSVKSVSGSKSAMELTAEQSRIVNHSLKQNDCMKIIAFAGTGKTATLVEYVRNHPDKKFLVLMFNKKAATEAVERFPKSNSVCLTTHSWALHSPCYVTDPGESGDCRVRMDSSGNFVRKPKQSVVCFGEHANYKKKLQFTSLKAKEVQKVLGNPYGFQHFELARLVTLTLNNFFHSNARSISISHVPDYDTKLDKNGFNIRIPEEKKPTIQDFAKDYWAKSRDFDNAKVTISHDGYLKLFQLEYRNPDEDEREPYHWEDCDVVLVDEAQDLNPATFDVIQRLNIPKIFVGDPHQQIYAFRGAIDALDMIQSTKIFHLTRSFRFGPAYDNCTAGIGFLANGWLEKINKVTGNMLIGSEIPSSHQAPCPDPEGGRIQQCIITRYNVTLFEQCVRIAYMNGNHTMKIIGQESKFKWNDLKQMYALTLTKKERIAAGLNFGDYGLMKFGDFHSLKKYAENHMDGDLLSNIRLVETYREKILEHIEKIEQRKPKGYEEEADYILTTAHMAKGLEFDHVLLTDDFALPGSVRSRTTQASNGEASNEYNLVYVAMTRARKSLQINRSIFKLKTEWMLDPPQKMITFGDALELGAELSTAYPSIDGGLPVGALFCLNCRKRFIYHPENLILFQPKIEGSWRFPTTQKENLAEIQPAVFCIPCSTQEDGLQTPIHSKEGEIDYYNARGISPEVSNQDYTRRALQTFLDQEYEDNSGLHEHHSDGPDEEGSGEEEDEDNFEDHL